jgi:glycogen(starch) synthase
MNILLISFEFPPYMNTGGIASYMLHLANALNNAKYSVTVFSATSSHSEITVLRNKEYTNYLIPSSDLATFRKDALHLFQQYVQNHKVDLIESPEVGACALEIKRCFPQIPLLVKLHTPGVVISKVSNSYQSLFTKLRYVAGALRRGQFDLGYWNRTDLKKELDPEYQICILADQLLSPSLALKKWAVHFWGLPSDKIIIVPNPFTLNDALTAAPLTGRSKTICFVGKLTVLKGMFALTKAVKQILMKYPEYKVVIAGRDEPISDSMPSMRAWMEEKLKDVIEKVEFTGTLKSEQVNDLLKRSRICLVPSLWENFPTVVLEAMAAGAVVAASNRGGIPELITDYEHGLLFNPMKPASIFSAVHELIQDESLQYRLALKGRKKIHEENSCERLTEKILSVYKPLNLQTKK